MQDSWAYKTPRSEIGDGKIRVLWIEDLPDIVIPDETRSFEDWFEIKYVTGPVGLRELMEHSAANAHHTLSCGEVCAQPELPCDVYITDFRLCDSLKEGCPSEEHKRIGLHAPSGGFLLGLLTALRWPRHPQAIIPYSAYSEEFGQIWRLCSAACPPNVHVLWDDSVGKGRREGGALIPLIPREFRNALLVSFASGAVHVPLAQRDRLAELAESSNGVVDANEVIWLVGEFGARPVKAGALFFDFLDDRSMTIPALAVREWLTGVPVGDSTERDARKLAEWYWRLRTSPLSRAVHRIIQDHSSRPGALSAAIEKGTLLLPPNPPSFPWLLKWKRAEARQLKESSESDMELRTQLVRLTFLYLLLREWHMRQGVKQRLAALSEKQRRIADLYVKIRNSEGEPEAVLLSLLEYAIKSQMSEEFATLLNEVAEHGTIGGLRLDEPSFLQDTYFELVEHEGDATSDGCEAVTWPIISEATIIQLVDPLPSTWDTNLTLNVSKLHGAALARLWSKDNEKDPENLKKLLNGDGSPLTPSEKVAAARYAREWMPREEDWPDWLR